MPERDTCLLESELLKIHSLHLEIVQATTPIDLNCIEPCSWHSPFGVNRKISCREAAVSMSHVRARKRAAQSDSQYFMFLEDDAIVDYSKLKALFDKLLRIKHMQVNAFAIHLFPEQYGIISYAAKDELLKLSMIPDYAVGYILNRKALNIFNSKSQNAVNEIADWPQFAKRIDWYAPFDSPIRHPKDSKSSYLVSSRILRRKSNAKFDVSGKIRFIRFLLMGSNNRKYGQNLIDNEKLRTKYQRRIKCK